jgi:putative ABC transport system permease protein
MNGNLKLAFQSLKSTKLRSLFTMLGIIVGVVSVLLILSLGEGAKQDVRNQVNEYGSDLLLIRPGNAATGQTGVAGSNLFSTFGTNGTMNDTDVEAVVNAPDVQTVAPLATVTGIVSYEGKPYQGGGVIATTHMFPQLLNHKTEFGEFFRETDEGRKFAVIGKQVAETLFQENVPVGKALDFRGERYIVKGVLEDFDTSPFTPGANYNNAIFIPYTTGKTVAEGNTQIFQILAKPSSADKVDSAQSQVTENLKKAHGGQEDFSVLKQTETLELTDQTLDILTGLVAAIAAISLFVGGIGVMNVMIVSVTERTHEIGIRKAVGATNQQILQQFLAEAVILSAVGGLLGVVAAYAIVLYLRLFTEIGPVLPLQYAALAILVAVVVGGLFGVAPAVKAARQDPITALRRE